MRVSDILHFIISGRVNILNTYNRIYLEVTLMSSKYWILQINRDHV